MAENDNKNKEPARKTNCPILLTCSLSEFKMNISGNIILTKKEWLIQFLISSNVYMNWILQLAWHIPTLKKKRDVIKSHLTEVQIIIQLKYCTNVFEILIDYHICKEITFRNQRYISYMCCVHPLSFLCNDYI